MPDPPPQIVHQLRALFDSVSTLSLATLDAEGRPHAANLYFAPDEALNLYFVSDPRSAHSRHVADRPDVAATLYAPVKMWQQIRGIQLHGTCMPLPDEQWGQAWRIYLKKFPHITEIEDLVRSQRFYRIQPRWFRLIDNTVRFGYKVETPWPIE